MPKNKKPLKTKKEMREFATELKALLEKYGLMLGVDIDGDTFGIHVDGFIAIDDGDNYYHMNEYSLYLDKHDLAEYIKENK